MGTESGLTLVTALIKPQMEGLVIQALHDLVPFPGFSLTEVRGQGRGRGAGGQYTATEYDFTYHRHLKLQMVCPTDVAPSICRIIATVAWTGRKGDGVIYTSPATSFVRIRETGEHPHEAPR